MTINALLLAISLPKRYYSTDLSIDELFSKEAEAYLSHVSAYDAEDFHGEKHDTILARIGTAKTKAEKVIQGIKTVFSFYESSDYGSAQNEFDALMSTLKDSIFTSLIDDSTYVRCGDNAYWIHIRRTRESGLFRIRPVNHIDERIQREPNELFHIPLPKRAYASNARFSLAGFPCLYLSTMLPLAWQECKYPKSFYYSEYQYEWSKISGLVDVQNELQFLSLFDPREILLWGIHTRYNDFSLWLEIVSRYLEAYPLVMACSFVNRSGDTSFKQEYIIPQMLMQWVHRNSEIVQGISYFTCADIHNMPMKWNGYNIAIPALLPHDKNGYSTRLRSKFTWSIPEYFECPITVKQKSSHDRERLYQYIDDVRCFSSKYHLPPRMAEHIGELHDISCSMISLLEHGDSMHMEVAIQTIRRINADARKIRSVNISQLISLSQSSNNPDAQVACAAESEFRQLCDTFNGMPNDKQSISNIIEKWDAVMWNDGLPNSHIRIYCMDEQEIKESRSVLHDNHYLYHFYKVEKDEDGVGAILQMVRKTGKSIHTLWKDGQERELSANNLEYLNFPIFVQINNNPFPQGPTTSTYKFIIAGYDKTDLLKNIKRITERT